MEEGRTHMKVTPKKIEANRKNAKKSTGPKTAPGKAASRWNALKHGILAKEVVVPTADGKEKRADFDALLARLHKDLRPEAALEEMLVEKIAVCHWRLARVLRCEGGEIKKGLDAAGGAEDAQGAAAQNPVKRFSIIPDLSQEMRTPSRALAYLTGVLQEVRKEAEQEGPLTREGGARLDGQSGEDGKPPDYKGGNQRARWLKKIDGQIEWLSLLRSAAQKTESAEMEAKVAPLHLPSQEAMEKLRRYEGMLERQLYRAMRQLERLQRLRKGEPVPPPISVEVAHE